MELEAESPEDLNEVASRVVDEFLSGLEAARDGTLPFAGYDQELQTAFGYVLRPLGRKVREITVRSDTTEIALTRAQVPGPLLKPQVESMSVGSMAGYIDAVNVHKAAVFYLYPTAGPIRVPCVFERDLLLDDVRNALKHYSLVYGSLEFHTGSAFPNRITVDRIEVIPDDAPPTTLRSLYGIAPELTQGLDSVSYVRRIRDAAN